MFAMARRYATIFAGACCLHLYAFNEGRMDPFFEEGDWLVACLERVLGRLRPSPRMKPAETDTRLADRLLVCADEPRMFSLIQTGVGGAPFDDRGSSVATRAGP
jgi:hypothetical protein